MYRQRYTDPGACTQQRNARSQLKTMFYCRFLLFFCFYVLCCYAAFRVNATSPPRNAKSSDNLQHIDSAGSTRYKGRSTEGLEGFEPGDVAPDFQVHTLDGVFIYSPQNDSSSALIVHAFTNKSAFLECLWTWSESLSDLLKYLPSNTEVLLLSLDDTAPQDALWMREQVYNAAAHGYRHIQYHINISHITLARFLSFYQTVPRFIMILDNTILLYSQMH